MRIPNGRIDLERRIAAIERLLSSELEQLKLAEEIEGTSKKDYETDTHIEVLTSSLLNLRARMDMMIASLKRISHLCVEYKDSPDILVQEIRRETERLF